MVNKKLLESRIKGLDLSISAFERKAGLKRNVVQNILHGKSKQPTPATLKALSDLLNCSIEELISTGINEELGINKKNRWNPDLLIEVINIICEESNLMGIKISSIEEIIPIIKETYLFSLENNEDDQKKIDKKFVRWILKKNYLD